MFYLIELFKFLGLYCLTGLVWSVVLVIGIAKTLYEKYGEDLFDRATDRYLSTCSGSWRHILINILLWPYKFSTNAFIIYDEIIQIISELQSTENEV